MKPAKVVPVDSTRGLANLTIEVAPECDTPILIVPQAERPETHWKLDGYCLWSAARAVLGGRISRNTMPRDAWLKAQRARAALAALVDLPVEICSDEEWLPGKAGDSECNVSIAMQPPAH